MYSYTPGFQVAVTMSVLGTLLFCIAGAFFVS